MASNDLELALNDLYEVMMIDAAGYPPHLMDRLEEILDNNDKTLDELYEKKRELEKEMKIARQKLEKAQKDLEESVESMRLMTLEMQQLLKDHEDATSAPLTSVEKDFIEDELRLNEERIKRAEEQICLTKLELEKLPKGTDSSTSTNGTEKDAETD